MHRPNEGQIIPTASKDNEMIYRFQPFATDKKDFGKVYNAHCRLVPNDEDWIQITDYDAMILHHSVYPVIDAAIARYPNTAIFGARCNRIALNWQRTTFDMDEETDSMEYHTKKAIELAECYSDGQCKDVAYVAGFFLLFRKSYWKLSPFQETIYDRKHVLFDYNFCQYARKTKMPIRVIMGVYCWHSYRIAQENRFSTAHLL